MTTAVNTKPCPECGGKLACSRCGASVDGDYRRGECLADAEDGGIQVVHDQAEFACIVNGCGTCHSSGRVPNEAIVHPAVRRAENLRAALAAVSARLEAHSDFVSTPYPSLLVLRDACEAALAADERERTK